MNDLTLARPVYLDVGGEQLFSFFHAAPAGAVADVAVLICPPFGWDDICSYRSRRDWADHLAARGVPALRFELPGAGDSSGSPHDPGRVAAWTASVSAAAAWLRAESGARRVVAVGIGLGGLLAVGAAAEGAPIDDFVLWGVPARGRSFVRELRAFAEVESTTIDLEGAEEPPLFAPGGFVLTAETIADLEAVDLTGVELPDAPDRRALLLDRDGISPDSRLEQRLLELGAEVTVLPGEGWGGMMEPPGHAWSPKSVFELVDAWLARGRAGRAAAGAGDTPGHADEIELSFDGRRVRERPFVAPMPFGRTFGVLAEPVDAPAADLCLVFLNAGGVRRVGPNRMWVEASRRWAARGVPSLRLDLRGMGDSDGGEGRYAEIAELYVPEFVDVLRDGLDTLEQQGFRRFVLLGLCSGAYWAFHGAVDDERVSAAVMINPRVLLWYRLVGHEQAARGARRHLLRPSSWRRVLRGEVSAAVTRLLLIARWAAMTPFRRGQPTADDLESRFDRLLDSRTSATFAFCGGEPIADELEREGFVARLGTWPNLRLERIAGVDHTLRPLSMQAAGHDVIDRAVAAEVERVATDAAPEPEIGASV